MIAGRGAFTVLATVAVSLAMLASPYSDGASFLHVNGAHSLVVLAPVALSVLALFSGRLRLFAGFLMLGWVVLGMLSVGLFYIPIAAFLLWPAKHGRDDGAVLTLH